MNKKSLLISVCVIIYTLSLHSQGGGVSISDEGDQTPHPSAILELISDDKGFLLPRMESNDRNSISDPSESLMIFNTETQCIEIYVGTEWHDLWCYEEGEEPAGCEGNPCQGIDPPEVDGYVFETIEIGNQCWFAENLNYLPEVWPATACGSYDDPRYYVVGYEGTDVDEAKAHANYSTYGVLYNWHAAVKDGDVCPDGWRLPTDDDWKELEQTIGMPVNQLDNTGFRGTNQGTMLKSTSGWDGDEQGTNECGFNVLPGGIHNACSIMAFGRLTRFRTSDETGMHQAIYRSFAHDEGGIDRNDSQAHNQGHYVRCVKIDY